MMPHRLNQPCRLIAIIALTFVALVTGAAHRCQGQYVTYPDVIYSDVTYPVTPSYVVTPQAELTHSEPIRPEPVRWEPIQQGSIQQGSIQQSSIEQSSIEQSSAASEPERRIASRWPSQQRRPDQYRPNQYISDQHKPDQRRSDWSIAPSARLRAAEFRRIAETASPIAAKIARENAEFAEHRADLADRYTALAKRVDDATLQLNTTTRDYQDVHSKIDRYGLTPTVGLLLKHKKEQLDAWQVHDSQSFFAGEELKRSRQKQLELELVRYDGADTVRQTGDLLAEAGFDSSRPQHASLASEVQGLLGQRYQWMESLRGGYQDYQQKLSELDSATTASAKLTSDYRNLISRHITWVRSGEPVSLHDVRNIPGGMAALFDSRRSQDFGPTLERKFKNHSVGAIGLLAFIVVILFLRWRCKSWLVGIGTRKRLREATGATQKVAAGVLTILVAFALPCILYAIARWLGTGIVSEATLHASAGFYAASLVALAVEVPRQLLRNHGYLDRHVAMELPRRKRAVQFLTVIGWGCAVAAYAVTVMGLIDHGMWRGSVSRFGFMATLMLVAWMNHLALRPTGGFLEPLIAKFGGKVIHRVRFVIYAVGVGFPLAMMALSALGYGFTANQWIKRALITMVLLLVAATLWAGVKILSARAWQMLTGGTPPPRQFDEYGEIETKQEAVSGTLGEHFLELKHQLAFLCQCALVLGAIVGLGWLWLDMVPHVHMGNPVLWNVQDSVTQATVNAAGQTVSHAVVETTPITVLHLAAAAATLFVAFQLAKLLPALFDALVLQRVSFDEGMEHFSLVLGRCLLFGIGCFIACKWLGLRWQVIEWLAVGLTIGLGFGLQDMVKNLFGGLIVLFEKPARLGDLITVGDVTGRVAMQKLRTTILSDEEGREVTVPNKNFVSEDVVNWRGAGRLTVIPIEVAVSRDQRPADVCRTLQELVIDQPDVLLTPAPQATLVCIGKRTQRIEVRAWIEDGQDASSFRDSLLKLVRKQLREDGLLASNQPSQPKMQREDDDRHRHGARRRSA